MRIYRYAVPADADTGLVDVRVGLAVGALDDFLDVHSDTVGILGKVVGQGDVHVSVRCVRDLAELGGLGATHGHDLGVQHRVVEVGSAEARLRPDATDQLGIGRKVGEDGAR